MVMVILKEKQNEAPTIAEGLDLNQFPFDLRLTVQLFVHRSTQKDPKVIKISFSRETSV